MRVVVALNGPATAAEQVVLARRDVPWLQAIRACGVDVPVALFGDGGGFGRVLHEAGLTTYTLPTRMAPRPSSLGRLPAAITRFRVLVAQLTPDLVEATEPMPAIAAGLAARGRCPVVYRRQHEHGRWTLVAASRAAARLAHRTIVSNEAMRAQAARMDRTPLDRVIVAPTGSPEPAPVPAAEIAELRRSLGGAADVPLVVAVSWLRHEKGLDVLIDAAARVQASRPVRLVIVGSGPEAAALQGRAAELGVPVHFPGHVDHVAPWYAAADVVAIPSRRESFGRTTLEAMAAARPIVASRVGGIPQAIVDGETGRLVPPDDPAALAAALLELLDHPGRAAALGSAAHAAWRSRFTIDGMAAARVRAWRVALTGSQA